MDRYVKMFLDKWKARIESGEAYIEGTWGRPGYSVKSDWEWNHDDSDALTLGRVSDSTIEKALDCGALVWNETSSKFELGGAA